MTNNNPIEDSNTEVKIYTHSDLQFYFYILCGFALCAGGLFLAGHFFNEIKPFFGAFIFIILLPVPMVCLGAYIINHTLQYKVILSQDKITLKDGTSTTEIDRSEIEAYRVTNDKIELKTESSIISQSIPKKFDANPEFADWFGGIRKVPEYKPSGDLKNSNYPQIYNIKLFYMLLYIPYLFIAFKVFQDFSNHTVIYLTPRMHVDFWGRWEAILGMFVLTYLYVIRTLGYKITLYRHSIEINSIIYNKKAMRNEIQSYRYSYGGRDCSKVFLTIKRPENQEISQGKEVVILLVFNLDQAFYNWFSDIPCRGGSPLPKIKEEFR